MFLEGGTGRGDQEKMGTLPTTRRAEGGQIDLPSCADMLELAGLLLNRRSDPSSEEGISTGPSGVMVHSAFFPSRTRVGPTLVVH
jgi:hypothetical protein